jgi:hypothetical protein
MDWDLAQKVRDHMMLLRQGCRQLLIKAPLYVRFNQSYARLNHGNLIIGQDSAYTTNYHTYMQFSKPILVGNRPFLDTFKTFFRVEEQTLGHKYNDENL